MASTVAGCTTELFRPLYHFTPPFGWMNDPNGLVFYDGEYHLFYQHYPFGTQWGPMHWGHAVSRNLLLWNDLPIALFPDQLGFIFSGSIVYDRSSSLLVAIFTHHKKGERSTPQSQSLAFSSDRGRNWTKYDANPVLSPPKGKKHFRDPKVFWYESTRKWVMVIVAMDRILLYSSSDLKTWRVLSEFGAKEGFHTRQLDKGQWECPDLFPLQYAGATHWVLLVSVKSGGPNGGSATQYFVGNFNGTHFVNANEPDVHYWLDYGRDNYAGVTFSGVDDGRVLWLGWMSNWRYATTVPHEGWRSAMTLPRSLHLVPKHGTESADSFLPSSLRLASRPVVELEILRDGQGHQLEPGYVLSLDASVALIPLPGLRDAMHFELVLAVSQLTGWIAIELADGDNAGERYRMTFDGVQSRVVSDRSHVRLKQFCDACGFGLKATAPLDVSINSTLHIHLFVDASSIEAFIDDGRLVMTEMLTPSHRFKHAVLTGDGFKLVHGTLYNLNPHGGMPNRPCANEEFHKQKAAIRSHAAAKNRKQREEAKLHSKPTLVPREASEPILVAPEPIPVPSELTLSGTRGSIPLVSEPTPSGARSSVPLASQPTPSGARSPIQLAITVPVVGTIVALWSR